MAVTTSIIQVNDNRHNHHHQQQHESDSKVLQTPLHFVCGACTCCKDTCGDRTCECAIGCGDSSSLSSTCCPSPPQGRGQRSNGVASYTMCEIRRHNTEESAWLVVGNDIYDVTSYVGQHPGGKRSILRKAGGAKDCTEDFHFHSKKGRSMWKRYYIGKVKPCPRMQLLSGSTGNFGSGGRPWWMFWQ